jgi:hypothetical protein
LCRHEEMIEIISYERIHVCSLEAEQENAAYLLPGLPDLRQEYHRLRLYVPL